MTKLKSNNNNLQSTILFLLLFFLIQLFDITRTEFISFIVKNIFLIVFLAYNIISYKRNNPERWLLNPAVLASIFTFLLGYCITSYVYFIPGSDDQELMYRLLGTDNLFFFNKGMNAIIIGAFAMWIGYNSKLGIRLYNFILRFPINFKKYFRSSFIPNLPAIYVIIALTIATRLYAINLGIYGYSATPERLTATIGISYILLSAGDMISLCLFVVSFAYFRNVKDFKFKFTFFLILIVQIIFGIISGVKSSVVMPFVLSFIIYYLVRNKLNKSLIIASFVFIIIAYIIIEPFRIVIRSEASFQSTPTNIANTMVDAYNLNKRTEVAPGSENIFTNIISRNAYLLAAAKSIQYEDVRGLGPLDPDFLGKILTIPLQTFIPRLFWTSKPVEDYAGWFAVLVWGSGSGGAVAMSPFGFLYFAGGLVFIFFGFLIIGVFQKTLWQFYLAGGGQLLIFLAFLSTVVLIDSAYNGMVVYWLRYFPIFIFLQTLLFKKTKPDFG